MAKFKFSNARQPIAEGEPGLSLGDSVNGSQCASFGVSMHLNGEGKPRSIGLRLTNAELKRAIHFWALGLFSYYDGWRSNTESRIFAANQLRKLADEIEAGKH